MSSPARGQHGKEQQGRRIEKRVTKKKVEGGKQIKDFVHVLDVDNESSHSSKYGLRDLNIRGSERVGYNQSPTQESLKAPRHCLSDGDSNQEESQERDGNEERTKGDHSSKMNLRSCDSYEAENQERDGNEERTKGNHSSKTDLRSSDSNQTESQETDGNQERTKDSHKKKEKKKPPRDGQSLCFRWCLSKSKISDGKPEETTDSQISNCKATIGPPRLVQFTGFGKEVTQSKFAKLDLETGYEDVWNELNSDKWQMRKPKFLISVTGGGPGFKPKPELESLFQYGLAETALTTDAWIITDGTAPGVAEMVGKAMFNHKTKTGRGMYERCVVLGITEWEGLANKEALEKGKETEGNQKETTKSQSSKEKPENEQPKCCQSSCFGWCVTKSKEGGTQSHQKNRNSGDGTDRRGSSLTPESAQPSGVSGEKPNQGESQKTDEKQEGTENSQSKEKPENEQPKGCQSSCFGWCVTKSKSNEQSGTKQPTSQQLDVEYTKGDVKGQVSRLDANHSHFLLIAADDKSKVAGYRAGLENFMAKKIVFEMEKTRDADTKAADTTQEKDPDADSKPDDKKKQIDFITPLVLFVIDGGFSSIQTVHESLKKDTPIIVINGSGRAADFISLAFNEIQKNTDKESVIVSELKSKATEMLDRNSPAKGKMQPDIDTKLKSEAKIQTFIDQIKKKLKLITIFNLEPDSSKNIEQAIAAALLKVRSSDNGNLALLELVLAWNKVDMARQLFFSPENGTEITDQDLQRLLKEALVQNKADFVELCLEYGMDLKHLKFGILKDIFIHSVNRDTSAKRLWDIINGEVPKKTKEEEGKFHATMSWSTSTMEQFQAVKELT